jgi:hypothetical protein
MGLLQCHPDENQLVVVGYVKDASKENINVCIIVGIDFGTKYPMLKSTTVTIPSPQWKW